MKTIQNLKQSINDQGGRFGTFSDNFYQFIREKIGITYLQEGSQKMSFEDRLAKIDLMLSRAEFEDDKLDVNELTLT